MATTDASPPRSARRAPRWFVGAGVVLIAALGALVGIRGWHLAFVTRHLPDTQLQVVSGALEEIEADWALLQRGMFAEAERLASDSEVRAHLLAFDDRADASGIQAYLAAYGVADQGSVEVYGADGTLLAWQGPTVQVDGDPERAAWRERPALGLINDAGVRRALTLWWPVRDAGRPIGVLRVSRLIAVRMPVENQFLRSYDPAESWRRLTRLPVEVRFDRSRLEPPAAPVPGDTPAPPWHGHALVSALGDTLGHVWVQAPGEASLVDATARRYADGLAVGMVLVLILVLTALNSWRRRGGRLLAHYPVRLVVFLAALVGARFLLLALEVPARWQRGKAPLAALFDPTHFASGFGAGLMQSMGDLLTTAVFALWAGWLIWDVAGRAPRPDRSRWPMLLLLPVVLWLLALTLGAVIWHAVMDSTLDYFARSGILPDRLTLFVFGALMLLALALAAAGSGSARWVFRGWVDRQGARPAWAGLLAVTAIIGAWVYRQGDGIDLAPLMAYLSFFSVCLVAGWLAARHPSRRSMTTLRRIAALTFALVLPVYLMLDRGAETQRRLRMQEAIDTFDTERDPGIVFAIEQLLERSRKDPAIHPELPPSPRRAGLNNILADIVLSSPLATPGSYEVSLTVFDSTGTVYGRYDETAMPGTMAESLDRDDFWILSRIYAEREDDDSLMVELLTGRRVAARLQYAGFAPIASETDVRSPGWIFVRLEPKTLLQDESTLFPRVLLPSHVLEVQGTFAIAEFRDGALYRNAGSVFGRYRLDDAVAGLLRLEDALWRKERINDRTYLTYYARRPFTPGGGIPTVAAPDKVVAIRAPVMSLFDHLYYMLRLTLAAALVLVVLYLVARLRRRRASERHTRFTDRVLNAFLTVGVTAVLVVGVLGLQVIHRENENAVQSWIDQQLDRVESTLLQQAEGGELPSDVLARTNVSLLAASVGLDLNVYRGRDLMASSRQQLVRDRLIDARLPLDAYRSLYGAGERNAYTYERAGTFVYRAGYRALPDRDGVPGLVLSVPTLPEQERIEEERARTVAYLFGSLLLVTMAVVLTAGLLANALTRPIGRLREGLEAVARGRFERPLPVETDDEIGQLVQTFNQMQEQLAESRRQLTQQERQLAWREMARQVAHEIKNPLTPMKLSIQHLRRAFTDAGTASGSGASKFAGLFDRITTTLIEQVDALARIANEFSTFARLPRQMLEPLDLNAVIQEAVALMQEQESTSITLRLDTSPLIIQGDREELRRIYINLIKNAIEATQEGRDNHIEVLSERREIDGAPAAYSSVSDTGAGIPEALRDRIFVPNFSTKTSGTGLGLAIVRKSVEDMRGQISFMTTPGEGTTFYMTWPLLPAE